ncbi:MAG: tetratricopeptide repeat protein [Terriglobales bacterium]
MESPFAPDSATLLPQVEDPAVPPAVVWAELEQLLVSPSLRDAELLKRFLRYIVEKTLAGEGDQLKEYRLGLEVLERDASFDPRLDPVVRMTARRLRAKLREHYESSGRDALVRIEVPKGGYAARFVAVSTPEVTAGQEVAGRNLAGQVHRPSPESRTGISGAWKASLAAAAVLVIAALVAGGFYYHSPQTKRLSDKDTILLADFANSTGDPVFDDTLKTALSVSLQQSPFLNVLSDHKIATTLQAMTRSTDTKLTPAVARELCQRAGSKAYIAGAIGTLGSDYVLQLKAVNCQSGDTLAQEQVTAAAKEKVLDTLGAAATKLRAELGESLAAVQRFDVPLVEATTASLEALKAFSLGQKVFAEKGPEAALPYDQQAIELDPNFALGYFEAGSDYYALAQLGRADEYLTRAFQLREHVSEREKLAIAAAYYRNVTGQLDKAIQTHQQAVESYPREYLAYVRLGVDFALTGQHGKAAEVTRQALRLDPDHVVAYIDLANYALALQHFNEARQIIQEAKVRKLDDLVLHNARYALAFLAANSAAMSEQLQGYSGTPEENYGLALASDTAGYAGHVGKARELTKRALDSAMRADSKETAAIWQENSALREAAYGYAPEARRKAPAALRLAPASQGVAVQAALAFAMADDTARAESIVRNLNQRFPLDTQMQLLWLPAIRAQVALDRKQPALALRVLQPTSNIELGLIPFANNISCLYPVYIRGEAYLATGDGSAAADEFRRIIDHNGIVWNCWTGALAHLGLARANALQSRTLQGADADAARVRARAAYKDFLMLWKDADPDIPILKEAKAEYAKLQ